MNAVFDGLGAGGFNRRQPVDQHRIEDVDHLPIAVSDAGELAPHPLHRGRQHPVFERRTVAQGTRLAGQHRHIMPGTVAGLAAAEATRMLGHDAAVLADDDAVGIGMHLDRASDRVRRNRV